MKYYLENFFVFVQLSICNFSRQSVCSQCFLVEVGMFGIEKMRNVTKTSFLLKKSARKFFLRIKAFLKDESSFKIPRLCFISCGFGNLNQTKLQRFLIGCIVFSGLLEFDYIVRNLKIIFKSTEALATFLTLIPAFLKAFTFYFKAAEIFDLMTRIELLDFDG